MYLSTAESKTARKLRIKMNGSDLGFKLDIIGWLICISCHLNSHMGNKHTLIISCYV